MTTVTAGQDTEAFRGVWRALNALSRTATPELAYQLAHQAIFLRSWPRPNGDGLPRSFGPVEPALRAAWTRLGLDRSMGQGAPKGGQARLLCGDADRSLAVLIREVAGVEEPGGLFDACLDRYSAQLGSGGDYYTSRPLARLMAGLAVPRTGERVLDPVCGSGRLLVAAERRAREPGSATGALHLHGRDIRPEARRVAAMNLMLNGLCHDLGDRAIDSLCAGPTQLSADVVLANPPLNAKDWGHQELSGDSRWSLGPPPKGNANFAWVQHALSELSSQGRAVVLLPDSATRRPNAQEWHIRRRLIERDLLAGIVALPPRFFPHTRTGTTLWLLAKDKSANPYWGRNSRVGEVLFADARWLSGRADQGGYRLVDEEIDQVCGVFASWRGAPAFQAVSDSAVKDASWWYSASTDGIARRDFDLGPGSYVRQMAVDSGVSVPEEAPERPVNELYECFDHAVTISRQLRHVLGAESMGRADT
ncbi:N-6 DNA methylase [Streptomyces sp. NPDC047017]|uniref:HsdM family class I SAM-dependent methyltransferase n=1 Tax=Streptomyces sp. NPDC047017 TaxID=3155024 RepID=UPI0033E07734